jgi:hypothetical protein
MADPKGFKAKCIWCGKPFYIPWVTMCDAGICDECLAKAKTADKSGATTHG